MQETMNMQKTIKAREVFIISVNRFFNAECEGTQTRICSGIDEGKTIMSFFKKYLSKVIFQLPGQVLQAVGYQLFSRLRKSFKISGPSVTIINQRLENSFTLRQQ
jgi:hypothetical protein